MLRKLKLFLLKYTNIPRGWVYVNYVPNPEVWDAPDPYYEYRICLKTGRWQRYDCQCMGLNPPTYMDGWYNIKEPKDKPKLYKDRFDKWRVRDAAKYYDVTTLWK